MNKFLTLIRRDMADNRGALIITPLVIAAIVLLLGAFTTMTGHSRFGFDPQDFKNEFSVSGSIDVDGAQRSIKTDAQGRVIITTPSGSRSLSDTIGPDGKATIAAVMPMGTAIVALMPIGVAAIIVLFLLSGSLYDERKDRTILFWKSMPVSDLANVGAKMVSIIGIGFLVALGVGMLMQLGSVLLATMGLARLGVTGIPMGAIFTNVGLIWLVGIVALMTYIGWALPVYAWFLAVSAAAPKAPFLAAILPVVLAPVIARVLGLPGDLNMWSIPLERLVGADAFGNISGNELQNLEKASSVLPVQQIITELTSTMAQPAFGIGLVVAAALIYAASEIRRRRAL
jgi:ABC-2 type transport system permease protein